MCGRAARARARQKSQDLGACLARARGARVCQQNTVQQQQQQQQLTLSSPALPVGALALE